jgi:branched-chain amino acid aminotransferase
MSQVAATYMSLPLVTVNGERIGMDAPAISPRDRGFTLADGLFETMRARRGVVFRLDRHLARLTHGLQVMSIPEPPEVRRWVERAVTDAGSHDLSIRLTVTRGPGPGGIAPPADVKPTVVVTISPMPVFSPDTYTKGLRGVIAVGRRNPQSATAGLKTLAYADAIVAWLDAQRAGADEAIFLDTDGHCSEATASNLFVVLNGTLVTPPVSCAALPGVTRAVVLDLASAAGITSEERAFDAEALATADEAFLTSSLRGIAPISSMDGQPIGSGAPGPVTARLGEAYRRLIDQECGVA